MYVCFLPTQPAALPKLQPASKTPKRLGFAARRRSCALPLSRVTPRDQASRCFIQLIDDTPRCPAPGRRICPFPTMINRQANVPRPPAHCSGCSTYLGMDTQMAELNVPLGLCARLVMAAKCGLVVPVHCMGLHTPHLTGHDLNCDQKRAKSSRGVGKF